MCGRYILVTTLEKIEDKFGLPPQHISLEPDYNISAGHLAAVITDEKPKEIQFYTFGMTPFWAKREMLLVNARGEGDSNRADTPGFRGAMGIIQKPAFRKPIRSQRCLVLASAFIEGPREAGLTKPFLIYLRNHQNPFAFAGIWDIWLDPQTGEEVASFSIITTTANTLLQKIGNPRMPVILDGKEAKKWIRTESHLSEIIPMLNPYDSRLMNAYPLDPGIKNPEVNNKSLILPAGKRLYDESEPKAAPQVATRGYHQNRKAATAGDKTSTMGDRMDQASPEDSNPENMQ
ncbi:MAG: SOS response-associated peptidase [Bacteroidota bacterium]